MRQIVAQHNELNETAEGLRKLKSAVRAAPTSAVDIMLGHIMGTAVAPLLPQGIRNEIADSVWKAICSMSERVEKELEGLEKMK
jgi:hypothetical protein